MGIRIRLIALLSLLALVLSPARSSAQSVNVRYFPETGHYVSGTFLDKFNSVPDPIKLFGYPLTDEIIAPELSPVAGMRVQYFQRVRFEYHPTEPSGSQVQLGELGRDLLALENPGTPPLVLPENHPACRSFAETGFQVCYAFLSFFDANGGEAQFGLPLSNIVTINGRLVQYFAKARFEWRPELPVGQRVVLTNLGQIYFGLYEDSNYLLPSNQDPNIPNTILKLKVSAFPLLAVMPANGEQTIYVLVQDQQLRPVQGAQITLTLRNASGVETRHTLLGTDANGLAAVTISLSGQPIGLTEVTVDANLNSLLQQQTRTSFRIWW